LGTGEDRGGEGRVMKQKEPIAHIDDAGNTHDLLEHLTESARLAETFAEAFHSEEWVRLAGMWHDLGKYSEDFQSYINAANNTDANIEQKKGRVDHSTAGALYALKRFGLHGKLLAYLIAGHHAGLPDGDSGESGAGSLTYRLDNGEERLQKALAKVGSVGFLDADKPKQKPLGGAEGLHLWLRMLYSALVDADFLDTEAFFNPQRTSQRGSIVGISDLKTEFDRFMDEMVVEPSDVNTVRSEVLQQCREAGKISDSLFTLTVPTGGGKTLSSLAFALEHVQAHGKERIIYAIPYTSIIEQTAEVFKKVMKNLPDEAVIEHHSNLDPERESAKSRLATENWDAPLIVTTNVQFFESLLGARSSICRKLHNIANSVVILDEAQLLPPEYLAPVLQVIRLLSTHYGVTFVLCTATQPALGSRFDPFGKLLLNGLDECREIVSDPDELFERLKRVDIVMPESWEPDTWEEIADEAAALGQVLLIVNTRSDAAALFAMMPEGTIHLSALMCPEHRSQVIATIKQRLKDGEPIRVVSTQLVEAGVDIDFPVVYRALAGMDSIAQAAGRCNREGKLDGFGAVRVFVPPKAAPAGLLRFGEQATRDIARNLPNDLLVPETFQRYFDRFYAQVHSYDKRGILGMLTPDKNLNIRFRTAAMDFSLIDDASQQSVVVRWGVKVGALLDQLRFQGPSRQLMRQLGRYSVTLPRYQFDLLAKQGDIDEIEGVYVLKESLYSERTGVVVSDKPLDPSSLMA
jgi:CRISPR-associated endonuclease/helicase Cas3